MKAGINDEDDDLNAAARFNNVDVDDENIACDDDFIEAREELCAELEEEGLRNLIALSLAGVTVKAALSDMFVSDALPLQQELGAS